MELDLLKVFGKTIQGLWIKILAALSSFGGWLISMVVYIYTYFGDSRLEMGLIILVMICFDLCWGVLSTVKRKKFILSQCLTKSAMKIAIYWSIFTMICLSEKGLNEDWFIASRVACAILCAAELWSVFGHILIIKPDTPVIKLLAKYLQGEMSRKLGIEETKIEELLNNEPTNEK